MSSEEALKQVHEEAAPLMDELDSIEWKLVEITRGYMNELSEELSNKGLHGWLAMDTDGDVGLFGGEPWLNEDQSTWKNNDGERVTIVYTQFRFAKYTAQYSLTRVGEYR